MLPLLLGLVLSASQVPTICVQHDRRSDWCKRPCERGTVSHVLVWREYLTCEEYLRQFQKKAKENHMPVLETPAQGGGVQSIPSDTTTFGDHSTGSGKGSPGGPGGVATIPGPASQGGQPPSESSPQAASPGSQVAGGGTMVPFAGGTVQAPYPGGAQSISERSSDTAR